MAQWKAEDEKQFQELLRRAEAQNRELAALAPPPPAPPQGGPARHAVSAPPAAAGGGAAREAQAVPSANKPQQRGGFSSLPLNTESLLILVLLIFLLRQNADRELIWALVYILVF